MNPEGNKNTVDLTKQPNTTGSALNTLSSAIFYLAILFFIIGFNFSDVMVGNWYQQFMPNLGSQQINDIIFIDSLKGYAISSRNVNPDTSSILRTTNGGDTWQIIQTLAPRRFSRIKFVNNLTGFISGGSGSGTPYLYKTTDGGNTWYVVTGATLGNALWGDMAVISEDTVWLTDANGLNGGVYRTTNGGANWDHQLNIGSSNPTNIYMYNKDTGFSADNVLYKTTNSGVNWLPVGTEDGFTDMHFVDNQTGWKSNGSMKKTTNGGLNWIQQTVPFGGNIVITGISKFACINKDTLLAVGGSYNTGGSPSTRGIIYRTIDGGNNWTFQIPDTSIHIVRYFYINFINKINGWVYNINPTGIHTATGGDPVWYTGIVQTSTEIPKEYKLYQNYPNPFNPKTNITYSVKRERSNVKLIVFDIQGRQIAELVNQKQNAGTYEVDSSGSGYSSGVYFYKLTVTSGKGGVYTETKKMLLIK